MVDDVPLGRLEDQIVWYSRKSASDKRWFRILKGVQLVAAAAVPVAATLDAPGVVTGTLGAAIVVIEGFQQLNQHQQNWASYRSTAEALKHEKYLYLAGAGPYEQARSPSKLLANRVEGLISQEHANWLEARERADEAVHERVTRR